MIELLVVPILPQYDPDLLLVSAGFDAAEGDMQGRMKLSPEGFGDMMTRLQRHVHCPVVAALEGGYNVRTVGFTPAHSRLFWKTHVGSEC